MNGFNLNIQYRQDLRDYPDFTLPVRDDFKRIEPRSHHGIEYAEGILSGTYGFMCQYDKQQNFDTIWSSVVDISTTRYSEHYSYAPTIAFRMAIK